MRPAAIPTTPTAIYTCCRISSVSKNLQFSFIDRTQQCRIALNLYIIMLQEKSWLHFNPCRYKLTYMHNPIPSCSTIIIVQVWTSLHPPHYTVYKYTSKLKLISSKTPEIPQSHPALLKKAQSPLRLHLTTWSVVLRSHPNTEFALLMHLRSWRASLREVDNLT